MEVAFVLGEVEVVMEVFRRLEGKITQYFVSVEEHHKL